MRIQLFRARTSFAGSLASVIVIGVLGLAGCGNSSTASAPATTTAAPGYSIVPAATVTAGLAEVQRIAATLQATLATDQKAATADLEKMYTTWYEFEGTIRAKDKDLYLQMEDGLGSIKLGVQENRPERITSGMVDLETGATAYLAANS